MIASDSTVGPEITRVTEVGVLARNGTGDVGRNDNKRKNYTAAAVTINCRGTAAAVTIKAFIIHSGRWCARHYVQSWNELRHLE
jgi:hypothetical protein